MPDFSETPALCLTNLPLVVSDTEIISDVKLKSYQPFCKDTERWLNVDSFANCGQPHNKELWALQRCHTLEDTITLSVTFLLHIECQVTFEPFCILESVGT